MGTRKIMRVAALVLCAWVLQAVEAVETYFQHRFEYEDSDQRIVNASAAAAKKQQHADWSGSTEALVRWNTQTVISSFGMDPGARVEIEVLSLAYHPSSRESALNRQAPVVFTLYDNDQWRVYSVLQLREMALRSPTILCHYPSYMRFAVRGGRASSQRIVFEVQKSSLYTLQMQVCGDATVTVSGYASMVNLDYDKQLSEHLGVEKLGLIPLYKGVMELCLSIAMLLPLLTTNLSKSTALIVIYGIMTLLWVAECLRRRRTVPSICFAFQMGLHIKTIEVTLKLWYYQEFSHSGVKGTIINTAQDISESIASASLIGVMLLAALGWSLTRDRLSRREFRLLVLIFVTYLSIALVKALCQSEDEICKAYLLSEYVVKSVMMLGVIVALNFTVSQLSLALTETRWNNFVTPLTYMKLTQFHRFRTVFLVYLLVPTCLLIINLLVISPPGSWRYDWVNDLVNECTTLYIFVNVGLILRPLDSYIYARLARGTNTEEADEGQSSPVLVPGQVRGTVVVPEADTARVSITDALESNRRLLARFPRALSIESASPLASPPSSVASPRHRSPPPTLVHSPNSNAGLANVQLDPL